LAKTILLTGITGFLGSHLSTALLIKGWHVIGLKRRSSSLHRISEFLSDIELHNLEEIDSSLSKFRMSMIDAVVHTATNYGRNGESFYRVFDSNTAFPLRILDLALRSNVTLFLNTDTILDKYLNLYAFSKNQFLEWVKYVSADTDLAFTNIKLEHVYGPHDDSSKFSSFVIRTCARNEPILSLTEGLQKRDFIYVDDVVSAYVALLENENISRSKFSQFELGSGYAVSIRSFVELAHRLSKSSTHLDFGAIPYRIGEVMHSCASPAHFNSLGWYPSYTLEQGIQSILNSEFGF